MFASRWLACSSVALNLRACSPDISITIAKTQYGERAEQKEKEVVNLREWLAEVLE